MPTPEHNPQSIPPSEIPPGWRLCRESERGKLARDTKFWGGLEWVDAQTPWQNPVNTWAKSTYITATPLPESEREVPVASPWIPLSEREPTEKDWDETHAVEYTTGKLRYTEYKPLQNGEKLNEHSTHWRRVELPPLPPAPAKTQREKDDEAYYEWEGAVLSETSYVVPSTAFFHALKTERAHFGGRSAEEVVGEIKEILDAWGPIGKPTENALRALLSPPKEGETKHE